MKNIAFLAAAAALPLAACTPDAEDQVGPKPSAMASADPVTSAANDPSLTTTMGADYVGLAGAGDRFEIESSRLALEKSQNEEVKAFAQMMIDQHTQSTAEVKAAAEAAGLTVAEPVLNPTQRQMLDNLSSLSGADFDSAYLGQQADAHQMALNLHRTYAQGGDTPQLRDAAGKIVTAVEMHIAELQALTGANSPAGRPSQN